MKKNCVRNIIIHEPDIRDVHALAGKVNEVHIAVIERKLNSSDLTTAEKVAVIDKILENLKLRECEGIIK